MLQLKPQHIFRKHFKLMSRRCKEFILMARREIYQDILLHIWIIRIINIVFRGCKFLLVYKLPNILQQTWYEWCSGISGIPACFISLLSFTSFHAAKLLQNDWIVLLRNPLFPLPLTSNSWPVQ